MILRDWNSSLQAELPHALDRGVAQAPGWKLSTDLFVWSLIKEFGDIKICSASASGVTRWSFSNTWKVRGVLAYCCVQTVIYFYLFNLQNKHRTELQLSIFPCTIYTVKQDNWTWIFENGRASIFYKLFWRTFISRVTAKLGRSTETEASSREKVLGTPYLPELL